MSDFNFKALDELSACRQMDIMEFIADFIATHGFSPSVREIMKGCGYRSTSSVMHQISKLRDLGKVEYQPKIARSIRIVEDK